MLDRILLVDDEENVLHGYVRNLRHHFDASVALGGAAALRALEEHPDFAVIVADMRMPGISGLEVLKAAQHLAPDTVRLMLTGNSDQRTAMDAVNDGRVFRFLTKPIGPEDLQCAIAAGVRQHHLQRAERELLDKTVVGCLRVLSDVLAMWDPEAMGRASLVRARAMVVGRDLGLSELWPLEVASLVSPFGHMGLPRELLAKFQGGAELTHSEAVLMETVPVRAGRLLAPIPRMEAVSEILRLHAKGFDGSGFPSDGPAGREIPLEARILRAVSDLTLLESRKRSLPVALEELRLHPAPYDPEVLAALVARFAPVETAEETVGLAGLRPGMVLARSITTRGGRVVMLAGQPLSEVHLDLLTSLSEVLDLQEPFRIRS